MPYIKQETRALIDGGEHAIIGFSPGELNYYLTKIMINWIGETPSYTDYNDAIGVLECVKLELYRRAVAPYEDQKIKENGDVFT